MRGINSKLFDLNTRTNAQTLTSKVINEIPEDQKKMINMKYDLKKMKTRLVSEKSEVQEIKKKAGFFEKRGFYKQTTYKINPADDESQFFNKSSVCDFEEASQTNISISPAKSNRQNYRASKTFKGDFFSSSLLKKTTPCLTPNLLTPLGSERDGSESRSNMSKWSGNKSNIINELSAINSVRKSKNSKASK
mmetsp:Transcript_29503/g.26083  ORF Transcript_29503/g.26083 Transcript_29503/m.26083 type:complete len:192 (+) Transcript_29503:753-1328(+)